MDKCREAFEKVFPIPAHWIEWSESKKRYDCHVGLVDRKCSEYNKMFEVWQSRQAEIDEKDKRIEELQAKVDAVEHVLGCAMIASKEVFQYADRIARALRGNDA